MGEGTAGLNVARLAGSRHAHGRTIVALAVFAATVASAQPAPPHQEAIDAYKVALARLEDHARGRRDLEAAFQAALKVGDALLAPGQDGKGIVLETLSAPEYQRLQNDLPGILVNREEVLFSQPDPDFFVQLAVGHGDEADRRFFAAFKATYPESVWPVYIQQQTDYSGCTRFGTGTLVDTYRRWAEYTRSFPGRYAATVQRETDRATRELTQSTCACGDSPTVERELQQFVRAFPASPARPAVNQRLRALQTGQSDIRPRCISG
jgi:hypothetical protein